MVNLTFENVTLSVISRDDECWLTAKDIADALYGYPERGCQIDTPFDGVFVKRVLRLYGRHSEEFTERMTALIEINTTGGVQKIRVFSLRGAHLLGMLARTERAKHFRRWVLDVIEQHEHERGILTTEYHQALAEFATGKARASLCGKGLSDWKQERKRSETRLTRIIKKMQPDIFKQITAR